MSTPYIENVPLTVHAHFGDSIVIDRELADKTVKFWDDQEGWVVCPTTCEDGQTTARLPGDSSYFLFPDDVTLYVTEHTGTPSFDEDPPQPHDGFSINEWLVSVSGEIVYLNNVGHARTPHQDHRLRLLQGQYDAYLEATGANT